MAKPKPVAAKKNDGSIRRTDLISVLDKARAAVDVRGTTGLEQAQHFIIRGGRVLAYNDRICISAPLKVNTDLQLTVSAEDLYGVLSEIPEDGVVLEAGEDGVSLIVRSSSTEAGMAALPLEGDLADLILSLKLDSLEPEDWQDLPSDFCKALNLCSFSASKDSADIAFSCLSIDCDGMGTGTIYSTDKWRISRYIFEDGGAFNFLLPLSAVLELIKHEIVQAQEVGPWIHFRDKAGLVFSVRAINTPFPDCKDFFAVEGVEFDLPDTLGLALHQALVFAPGEDKELREAELFFEKGKVKVHSRNDRGWIKRSVLVPGLEVPEGMSRLLINPEFFIDILQQATTITVSKSQALFSAGAFNHVMMLPAEGEGDEVQAVLENR